MRKSWLSVLVGLLGVLLVLALACAPAAQATPTAVPPRPTATPAPGQPTATPAPAQPTPTAARAQPPPTPQAVAATPTAVAKAAAKGKVVIAGALDFQAIDYYNALKMAWVTSNMSDTVYGKLLGVTAQGEFKPGLATSWKASADGLEWTVSVRTGLKYHNGDPLRIEDYVYAYELVTSNPENMAGIQFYNSYYDSVRAVGNDQIVVRTKQVFPDFVGSQLMYGNPPHPKEYIKKVGLEKFVAHPIGLGPYKFAQWRMAELIEFEAFDGYFDPSEASTVRNVVQMVVPEAAARMAMLRTGEADIMDTVPPTYYDRLETTPGLRSLGRMTSAAVRLNPWDIIDPNSPFRDVRVRRAIQYGVNKQAIIEKLYRGHAVIATTHVGPTAMMYVQQEPYPYDPAKAKALLAEAGYPNGFEMDLNFYVSPSTWGLPEISEVVVDQMKAIGITLRLKKWDVIPYHTKWRDKTMRGLATHSNRGGVYSTASFSAFFGCKGAYSYYCDPELDKRIAKADTTVDPVERRKYIEAITKEIYDLQLDIPLLSAKNVFGLGPRIKEWSPLWIEPYPSAFYSIRLKD